MRLKQRREMAFWNINIKRKGKNKAWTFKEVQNLINFAPVHGSIYYHKLLGIDIDIDTGYRYWVYITINYWLNYWVLPSTKI